MTENEFMLKAVKAAHRAANELSNADPEFDEDIFVLWSSVHMAHLAEEIFDRKGNK